MPIFHYHARDQQKQIVTGTVEAANETIAADALRDRGFEVIDLEESKRQILAGLTLERVKTRDVVIFIRQLAVLIGAKVALVQALKTVVKQTPNKALEKILLAVADDVEAGSKLSVAMARHPKVFDNFFTNMIRSGETSGRLDEVLEYLADQKEKDFDLMSKIKGAMIYPAFIIFGMSAVGLILMIYVVPQLTGILKESGATLPLTTRILMGTSDFLKKFWLLLLIVLAAVVAGFRYSLRYPEIRLAWDTFKLRLPILGSLFQKIYLVRFSRSLETVLLGGVALVDGLKIAADVVQNALYQNLIRHTVKEVEDGNSITSVFSGSKLVPTMVNQMLAVGEETGRLSEILKKMSAFYAREIDNSVRSLVSIIEPIIMIVMGVAVGVIVSAIILPMYKLASQF